MLVVSHNLMAMNANRQFNIVTKNKAKSNEKLSSGYRINRAADDAAGLSISEKMRNQIRGLNQGSKNLQDGISFSNVAEGALQEVHNLLGRMKELSVKAANDTNALEDRKAINYEIECLKREINKISRGTEFNGKKIFQKDYAIEFSDDIQVVQIFDANNGDPLDPDSYGGIIIDGDTRIVWSDIDADMVYQDPDTGETVFKEGTYKVNAGGYDLTIECKAGSKPPDISAHFSLEASGAGITVAGTLISWDNVKSEDNVSIKDSMKEGIYYFDYGSGQGSFTIGECSGIDDVIAGINHRNETYSRKYMSVYNGYYTKQAVDVVDTGSKMQVNQSIYNALVNHQDLDATLKADDSGIWIVDAAGNELSGSKKTWSDLGINSWDSGSDISDSKDYSYIYNQNGYDIQFDFFLIDETSKESVIEGINNAKISDQTIITNNETSLQFTANTNVTNGVIKSQNNHLDVYEEAALGRDFGVQSADLQAQSLVYNETNDGFSLVYNNVTTGLAELEYESSSMTSKATLKNNVEVYLDYLSAREVQRLITGAADIADTTLDDVLGTDKVNQDNYLSESIQITDAMNKTDKLPNGNHPGAIIDFSGFGQNYEWYDLLGTGFNSTCMTCDNHYSVMFTYGTADNTTSKGYGYSKTIDGQGNYTLQIDLKMIMDRGVQTGEQFADALVNVMKESNFDFHFTQYASDGANFYVCDNRTASDSQAKNATFDTEPYEVGTSVVDVKMTETGSNRYMNLSYTYDVTSGATVTAAVEVATDGNFVDNGSGGYKQYVKSDYYDANGNLLNGASTPPTRYNIKLTNNISSWDDYYDDVMKDIANHSTVTLSSTDFDYLSYKANERANSAVVSTFDFRIVEEGQGFWIQSGANAGEGLAMHWDTFSTYTLGIGNSDVLSHQSASKLIDGVEKATKTISAMRSAFGAYTNRMEYMYANNGNYSENLQKAESGIRDTDMADEMIGYSKNQILQQVGQSMIAQANQQNKSVLDLVL